MGKKGENEREIEVYWNRRIEDMSDEELVEWVEKLPINEEEKRKLRLRLKLEKVEEGCGRV